MRLIHDKTRKLCYVPFVGEFGAVARACAFQQVAQIRFTDATCGLNLLVFRSAPGGVSSDTPVLCFHKIRIDLICST